MLKRSCNCESLLGSAQDSCDSLSYKTLMNVDTLKSYMDMLRETHWLVVMGTKGTCKTSLASGLARHLSMSLINEEEIEEEDEELMITIGGEVISYNIDKDGLDVRIQPWPLHEWWWIEIVWRCSANIILKKEY